MTQFATDPAPTLERDDAAAGAMPNLFVIGASKTGSSALHAYLRLHPQIFMSAEKEPCFFVDQQELEEAWPIMARKPVSHDIAAYRAMFRDGSDLAYRGEASVYYSQYPHRSGVAARIAAAVPEARILYIVREPVTRTIAHYWQRAKEFQDLLPIEEAIRSNPIYRDTSDYAAQLDQYRKVFDDSQIHVIVSEELRSDRRAVLNGLFQWLGVECHDFLEEDLADVHVSSSKSRRQRFGFVRTIRDSGIWAKARQSLPSPVVDRLRDLATESFDKKAVEDREIRAWLREYFAPRIDRFEDMIGRRLDVWRADVHKPR
ncbi:MAG: sulfotransferase [Rhodobacteraceae bacterium]|nr:sulfotransferase [Paracoccaceae bacterium]MAY45204.1 sulfotransferase [Paracoccaceae bacterium]